VWGLVVFGRGCKNQRPRVDCASQLGTNVQVMNDGARKLCRQADADLLSRHDRGSDFFLVPREPVNGRGLGKGFVFDVSWTVLQGMDLAQG
jgi:hypothetical protein